MPAMVTAEATSDEDFKKMWETYQGIVSKGVEQYAHKGTKGELVKICEQLAPSSVKELDAKNKKGDSKDGKTKASTSHDMKSIGKKIVCQGVFAHQKWSLDIIRPALITLADELPGRAAQVIDGILDATYLAKDKKYFAYRMEPFLYEIAVMLRMGKTSADDKMIKDARKNWDKYGWFVLDPSKVRKIESERKKRRNADASESRTSSVPEQSSSERKTKRFERFSKFEFLIANRITSLCALGIYFIWCIV